MPPKGLEIGKKLPPKLFSIILDPALNREVHFFRSYKRAMAGFGLFIGGKVYYPISSKKKLNKCIYIDWFHEYLTIIKLEP